MSDIGNGESLPTDRHSLVTSLPQLEPVTFGVTSGPLEGGVRIRRGRRIKPG